MLRQGSILEMIPPCSYPLKVGFQPWFLSVSPTFPVFSDALIVGDVHPWLSTLTGLTTLTGRVGGVVRVVVLDSPAGSVLAGSAAAAQRSVSVARWRL
jgi:hypothetical protein